MSKAVTKTDGRDPTVFSETAVSNLKECMTARGSRQTLLIVLLVHLVCKAEFACQFSKSIAVLSVDANLQNFRENIYELDIISKILVVTYFEVSASPY